MFARTLPLLVSRVSSEGYMGSPAVSADSEVFKPFGKCCFPPFWFPATWGFGASPDTATQSGVLSPQSTAQEKGHWLMEIPEVV